MVSARFPLTILAHRRMQRLKARVARWKQRVLNTMLSGLFEAPVQVVPASHVGLAGAVVLWAMKDERRFTVMLRSKATANGGEATDLRAKLPSCVGLGRFETMAAAMQHAVTRQFGGVFAQTLPLKAIATDRVAAAPLYTYVDETTGLEAPMQMLIWVIPVQMVQVDLMKLPDNYDLVLVDDATLESATPPASLSPTHVALWKSIRRHLPRVRTRAEPATRTEAAEETPADAPDAKGRSSKRLH